MPSKQQLMHQSLAHSADADSALGAYASGWRDVFQSIETRYALAEACRSRQKAGLAIGPNDLVIDSRIAAASGNELSTLNRCKDRQRSAPDQPVFVF